MLSNPDYIKENLEQIGLKESLALLKELINSSNDPKIRKKSIKLFGIIDNCKNFKFLEQLFLSDEDLHIKMIAGNILRDKYSDKKKLITLLEYTLKKIINVEQKIYAIYSLKSIDNYKTRNILIEYLKDFIKNKFKDKINQFPEEIFRFNCNNTIPDNFIEVCINLVLSDYYKNKCGFLVTIRKGKIISLNCESSNIKNLLEIKGLVYLWHLEHLILQRNNIRSCHNLHLLNNLKTLDLSYNKIEKIENLNNLNDLEVLDLSNNKIKIIVNLESLKELKKLSLNNNLIKEIDNLNSLVSLEDLNLSHNMIKDIRNLEHLAKLKRLNLSFNHIEKIMGLSKLNNLLWLYLNDNRISQIEVLMSADKLKGLYLSNNSIKKIEFLDNLINLKKLDLSNNEIKKIEGLDHLAELQELYLDGNNIKELEGFDGLKNLIIFHIGRNNLSKFRNESIKNLTNLNFLFLNENPLDMESWDQYKKRFRFP
ncbi:MAG: leucine-rich repeat protein [Promethearchaeota archaeon]